MGKYVNFYEHIYKHICNMFITQCTHFSKELFVTYRHSYSLKENVLQNQF